jgi:hypothetical protein
MKTLKLTALALAISTTVLAQTSINNRRERQQDRIADGVRSGELTPAEAAKLEAKEAKLNQTIRKEKAENGGTLTPAEKAAVEKRQNNLSRQIYNEKHDAAKTHYGNNEVDQRRYNQQQRIANGIESGQIKPGEAAKLEGQEAKINREVRRDRVANGGKLTPAEKAKINREQNQESRRIYRDRHN